MQQPRVGNPTRATTSLSNFRRSGDTLTYPGLAAAYVPRAIGGSINQTINRASPTVIERERTPENTRDKIRGQLLLQKLRLGLLVLEVEIVLSCSAKPPLYLWK